MKTMFLAVLMLLAGHAAWAATAVPPEVAARQQRLAAQLAPAARDWVRQQALIVRASPPAAAGTLAANAARQRFGSQLHSEAQLDALVFLVLHESIALEPLPPPGPVAATRQAPQRTGSSGPDDELGGLNLQMAMQRRSQVIALLSNLMKKQSATQDAQVQNLK